jgi:hypothetical protein
VPLAYSGGMLRLRLASCAFFLPAVIAFAACSGGTKATGGGFTAGANGGSGAGTGTAVGGGSGNGVGGSTTSGGLMIDASGGVGGSTTSGGDGGPAYLIYAHTDTTLFTLDPTSANLALTQVGTFDCIGASGTPDQQSTAMTDFAVDRNQNLWGLSSYAVRTITIQGTTAHCGTEIEVHVLDPNAGDSGFPYIKFEALTFAPAGVIKAGVEMLVAGNTAGQLWVIDTSTSPATITQHGAFGTVPANDGLGHNYMYPGGLWELSGDIVFLANNGSPVGFATVRDCPNPPDNSGCNQVDTLIEVDMTALQQAGTQSVTKGIRGQVIEKSSCGGDGSFGFGNLFGIASWNGDVYGFSRGGDLVQIDNVDGTACLVKNYPTDLFAGAAVTTVAPVVPPPIQ